MSESFTPGPWKVDTWFYPQAVLEVDRAKLCIENGHDLIAQLCQLWRPDDKEVPALEVGEDKMYANARLIAAAPAYHAFIQMIANGGLDSGDSHEQIEIEARNLLAQAEGHDREPSGVDQWGGRDDLH